MACGDKAAPGSRKAARPVPDGLSGVRAAAEYGAPAADTVRDLVEFGDIAARLIARGKHAYDRDETLRLASEAILHRIGEGVARLGRQAPQLLADHPALAWARMKAARNIVAHDYARIDHDILWTALAVQVPEVTAYLRRLLTD